MIGFLNWWFGDVMLPASLVVGVVLIATWPTRLSTPITGWLFMRRVRAIERSRPGGGTTTPDVRARQPASGERAGAMCAVAAAASVPASSALADADITCPASAGPQTLVGAADPRCAAPTRLHEDAS